MKPRKATSSPKNASTLPADIQNLIIGQLRDQFSEFLADKELQILSQIYSKEIVVCAVIFEKDAKLRRMNFEASVDFDANDSKAIDKIDLCIEGIASMIQNYAESDGDVLLPNDWSAFEIESTLTFLRFHTLNQELEAMADALLGENEPETAFDPESPIH